MDRLNYNVVDLFKIYLINVVIFLLVGKFDKWDCVVVKVWLESFVLFNIKNIWLVEKVLCFDEVYYVYWISVKCDLYEIGGKGRD